MNSLEQPLFPFVQIVNDLCELVRNIGGLFFCIGDDARVHVQELDDGIQIAETHGLALTLLNPIIGGSLDVALFRNIVGRQTKFFSPVSDPVSYFFRVE